MLTSSLIATMRITVIDLQRPVLLSLRSPDSLILIAIVAHLQDIHHESSKRAQSVNVARQPQVPLRLGNPACRAWCKGSDEHGARGKPLTGAGKRNETDVRSNSGHSTSRRLATLREQARERRVGSREDDREQRADGEDDATALDALLFCRRGSLPLEPVDAEGDGRAEGDCEAALRARQRD